MCLSGMCAGKRGDSHDLGYGLRKEFWRKGVCTEACRAVVDKLKQTGIPYATATHDVDNPRSGKVMQAIGMKYQYSYEELWQPKNILVTFRMYQLNLDGQWNAVYKTLPTIDVTRFHATPEME